MIELHVIFKGRVQGVGFRWTVLDRAEKMGLSGTVKNLTNGDVEVFACGSEEDLETFLEAIKKDSGSASITSAKAFYGPLTKSFQGFHIVGL